LTISSQRFCGCLSRHACTPTSFRLTAGVNPPSPHFFSAAAGTFKQTGVSGLRKAEQGAGGQDGA